MHLPPFHLLFYLYMTLYICIYLMQSSYISLNSTCMLGGFLDSVTT